MVKLIFSSDEQPYLFVFNFLNIGAKSLNITSAFCTSVIKPIQCWLQFLLESWSKSSIYSSKMGNHFFSKVFKKLVDIKLETQCKKIVLFEKFSIHIVIA